MSEVKTGKFYSVKAMALIMGSRYARQEKQDVYLHEANIGPDQFEYSLRFRDEIVNPESSNILRHWEYVQPNASNVVVKNRTRKLERTAYGYESNLPAGASSDGSAPFNESEAHTCPTCEGESAKPEGDYCSTCECAGELTEQGYPAHIN